MPITIRPAATADAPRIVKVYEALEELAATYPEAILWTLADYDQGQRFYESTGWTADGGTRAGGSQVSYRRTF